MNWRPIAGFAVAVFDFNPQGDYQIALKLGDLVELHEEYIDGTWLKGTVLSESRNEGIFPKDFVKMRPDYDDLISELSIVIKEWSGLMKSYLKEKKLYEFLQVRHKLEMLLTYHQKLLVPPTTYAKTIGGIDPSAVLRSELRSVVLAKLEEGRRQLGQDLIVKTDQGEIAHEGNTPTMQLYKKHSNMQHGQRLRRKSTKNNSELRSLRSVFSKKAGAESSIINETSPLLDVAVMKHLCLDMKVLLCPINSDSEMLFYLYNKTTNEVITETYNVDLNASGVSANLDKLLAEITIFKDLTPKEPLLDIYLVCEVYRIGKLVADKESIIVQQSKKDGKKKGVAMYRRPFAIGALHLQQSSLKPGKEVEYTIPLFSVREETQFHMARELAIKDLGGLDPIPRADGVRVGLNLIVGDLQQAFSKIPQSITPRIHRVAYPGSDFDLPRNDLYVTFVSGDFLASLKSPRVKLYLRSWNPKTQELKAQPAIWRGTGQEKPSEEYQCYVVLRCDKPTWNNTVKIQIPAALYPSCHLFFTISEAKDGEEKKDKEATMMAYLGLTDAEGAILTDNTHTLTCFKPAKGVDSKKEPSFYIPSKNRVVARKETLKIKTQLISNQISQNGWLYKLLTWSNMDPAVLPEVMNRITFVDAHEISRFMKETLDAIFALLDSKMTHLHEAVFNVLVFVIGILTDEKKTKAIPASRVSLDKYLETDFAVIGQFTHKHLIKCLQNYFTLYESKPVSELNSVLKALEYVLKFTLKSRALFKSKSQIKDDVEFKKLIVDWLDKLYIMMENPKPAFLGPQTIAIQAISASFNTLYAVFSTQEMAAIAMSFLGKIKYYEDKKLLNIQKLLFLHALATSDLFKFVDVRNMLLPSALKQLRLHINSRIVEERNESVKVLQRLLETVELQRWNGLDEGNVAEFMQVIPDLQQLLLNNKFETGGTDNEEKDLYNVLIVLFAIYHLMEPHQLDELITQMPPGQQATYITNTLKLLGGIVAQELPSFPENWFSLIMFQNSVVLKVFILLGHSVEQRVSRIDEELEMWSHYFKANLSFVNCATLNLESFSEAKRKMIFSRYSDMRRDALDVLEVIWNGLGVHQFKFVEQMVVPIIELMLSEQKEMKMKGNSLYLSLMITEFSNSKTKTVETTARITTGVLSQLFDKLLQACPEPQSFFLQALGPDLQVAIAQEPAFGPISGAFLQDMQTVIVLLRDSNSYPFDDIWMDEVVAAHLRLVGYLAKTSRWKTWAHHLHQLFKTHLATNNLTEAANTLLLHADKINWNDQKMHDAVGSFPRQTGAERKESLLRQAIDLFNQAKMWECALPHIGELLNKFVNDPMKVKELRELETLFQQNITTSSRFFNEYFYVGYFGKGFHPSIRNKEFIYRGNEFARLDDFTSRIQAKFPDAKMLTYTNYPPAEVINSPAKHLQIFAVKPRAEEPYATPPGPRAILDGQINQAQYKFFQSNRVKNFVYSKSGRRNKQKDEQPEDEVADTWITNTVYTTAQQFPHLQRRIEIVKKTSEESSPIQVAINQVIMRSTDVAQIVLKHKGGSTDNLVNFTMVLQGTINPTVNQGTKLFKKAFLSDKYAAENPDKADQIQRLRETIIEQVEILGEALMIHAGFCSPEMAIMQEELERNMAQLRQEWGLPPLPGSENLLNTASDAGSDSIVSRSNTLSKFKASSRALTPGTTKSPLPVRKPSVKPNPK